MKIAQISTLAGPGPIAGGVWQVQAMQASALLEAGHEVRVLSGWAGKVPTDNVGDVPFDILRLRRPMPGSGLRALWTPHLRSAVLNLARWADVAHVHLCRDLVTTPASLILARAGVPVIAQPHGMLLRPRNQFHSSYDAAFTRRLLPKLADTLYLTDEEHGELRGLGLPESRLHRVDNACIDPAYRWVDPTTPTFAFASRLHPRKQPMIFVEAALSHLASGGKADFLVIGPDQGEEARLRRRVAESAHRDRFRFLGALDHDDLMRTLRGVTAMVLPSVDEPYPMVVIEALAMGVPAIVTTSVGIRDRLEKAAAAVLVEPDQAEVARAVGRLAADPAARRGLSAAGRRLYEGAWRPRTVADQLEVRYQACLSHEISAR